MKRGAGEAKEKRTPLGCSGARRVMSGALAALCWVAVLGGLGAQEEAAQGEPLSAEVEAAFREFSRKAAESRREDSARKVQQMAERVAKLWKLDEAAKARLAELQPRVIESMQAGWQDRFRDWLTPFLRQSGDALATLEEWNPEEMARSGNEIPGRVDGNAVWREGLREILTAEQWEEAERQEAERVEQAKRDWKEFLDAAELQTREMMRPMIDAPLNEALQVETLDEGRRAELRAAADAAVTAAVQGWRERAEAKLLEMEDEARDMLVQQGGIGVDTSEPGFQPAEQAAWREAFERVLTPEERGALDQRRADFRARRSEALAMALLDGLDEFVGFTAAQREALLPLVREPMEKLPPHYFVPPGGGYTSVDPSQLMGQVKEIEEERLRSVLDENQTQRWKGVTPQQLARHNRYGSNREVLAGVEFPAEKEMTAVDGERLLTRYLHRRMSEIRRWHRAMMEARAESVARVTGLGPDAQRTLLTAAKGAGELAAAQEIANLENWVRNSFREVPPADLIKRLQNLNGPYFAMQAQPEFPRWTAAVQRVLSEAQRAAWEAEEQARQAWRRRMVGSLVVTEIEKSVVLGAETRSRLQEGVAEVLRTYDEKLTQSLSPWWHCEGYYAPIPILLIGDAALGEILTPDQISRVKARFPGGIDEMVQQFRAPQDAPEEPVEVEVGAGDQPAAEAEAAEPAAEAAQPDGAGAEDAAAPDKPEVDRQPEPPPEPAPPE